MRKTTIILLGLCLAFTSCGKKDDKSIKYDGAQNINIVLKETYNLNVSSKDALNYYSDDELVVTVSQDGNIYGKNVGEANVMICNSENELKLHVDVSLFEEPTLNFGCSRNNIVSLYGQPTYLTDSVIVYSNWYSYAVWSMSFFFKNNSYYESDLYIRNDLDMRVDQYLKENFHYYGEVTDDNGKKIFVYLDESSEEDASVLVGKQYNANKDGDICLIYIPYTPESRDVIRRRH